jgi:hypothetical protein
MFPKKLAMMHPTGIDDSLLSALQFQKLPQARGPCLLRRAIPAEPAKKWNFAALRAEC